MKKRLLTLTLAIAMLIGSSMTAYAAPKTMPDGTTFDAEYYANTYPDVKAALGTDETALYNHYVTYGKTEGRKPYADAQVAAPAATTERKTVDGQPAYMISYFEYNADGTVATPRGITNIDGYTPDDILKSIKAILPTGTKWGMEKSYNWVGDRNGDGIRANVVACEAFAFYLQDAIFDETPATQDIEGELVFHQDDIVSLFSNYGGHCGLVLDINNENRTVTVAEGGYNDTVRWGGVYSFDDIVVVITRY